MIAAMLVAPLLLILTELVSPIDHERDSPEQILATLGRSGGQYQASLLLMLGGMALMIPATIVLTRIARAPGQRVSRLGGVFLITGMVMFCANIGAMGLSLTALAVLPADQRATAVPAVTAIMDGKGAITFIIPPLVLGVTLGSILVTIGLWRSRTLPRWACLAFVGGWWLFMFGPSHELRAAGALTLLACLGPAAWRIVAENRPRTLHAANPSVA
jgi:hypothetical protein